MSATGYLPTIDQLVANDLGETTIPDTYFGDFLKKKFNNSIAPLLLMTRSEVGDVPLVGKVRRRIIEEMLQEHGIRFRSPTETLTERAIQLYGSVRETPIQALLLTRPSRRRNRELEYRSCYILRVLSEFQQGIKLDSFLHRNIGAQLRAILLFADQTVHQREFDLGVNELTTRMAYWEKADK